MSLFYGPGAKSLDEEEKNNLNVHQQCIATGKQYPLLCLEVIRRLQRVLLQKKFWCTTFLFSNFQIIKTSLENCSTDSGYAVNTHRLWSQRDLGLIVALQVKNCDLGHKASIHRVMRIKRYTS